MLLVGVEIFVCEWCWRSMPNGMTVCGDHPNERAVRLRPNAPDTIALDPLEIPPLRRYVFDGEIVGLPLITALHSLDIKHASAERFDPDRWSYIADAPGRAHGAEVTA